MVKERQKPTWWTDLRGEWETEPLARTWPHSLLTAVAVIVCLMLAGLLHLKESYWAAISVMVVMQPDTKLTVSAARDRLLGTAVGAVMGWLAALVWHGNVLVFGLAVAISLAVCGILGLKNAKRLAGATICLVVLVPAAGPKWRMALDRFVAVSFGIIVAVAISVLLQVLLQRWTKPRG
jgi:uncharacterized membrane protein YccC